MGHVDLLSLECQTSLAILVLFLIFFFSMFVFMSGISEN